MDDFQKLSRVSRMHEMGALPYRATTEAPQRWEKCVHHGVPQRKIPTPCDGEEQFQAVLHTDGQLAKNQLCKGTGGTGEEANHEIPMRPCCKEVQKHPEIYY